MMKMNRLFSAIAVVVLGLQIVGCAPSNVQIELAVAKTQTAAPYPTQTLYSTQTFYPTQTLYPTETPVPTVEPRFRSITWAELVDFILEDHTNWNTWSTKYNCVNFSMDLIINAKKQRFEAWIVVVTFVNNAEGHAFVAFPTTDSGVIWIEPQSDDAYIVSKIGQLLCLADNPNQCWSYGKITNIIQPTVCDAITRECWQGNE